jgi:hypothetical protein
MKKAVDPRHVILEYTGGNAQQQTSAAHAQAQVQDDWRDGGAYRQREAETTAFFFGGMGGANPPPPLPLLPLGTQSCCGYPSL